MLRVFLGGEMANFGSTKIFVDKVLWNNTTSRLKGRTADAITANAALDGISHTLNSIYRKLEDDVSLSMDKIRSFYCGKTKEYTEFLPVFDSFIDDIKQRVGKTISKDSLQKYSVLHRHFFEFQTRINTDYLSIRDSYYLVWYNNWEEDFGTKEYLTQYVKSLYI